MEGNVVVFDRANQRIGFAPSNMSHPDVGPCGKKPPRGPGKGFFRAMNGQIYLELPPYLNAKERQTWEYHPKNISLAVTVTRTRTVLWQEQYRTGT